MRMATSRRGAQHHALAIQLGLRHGWVRCMDAVARTRVTLQLAAGRSTIVEPLDQRQHVPPPAGCRLLAAASAFIVL